MSRTIPSPSCQIIHHQTLSPVSSTKLIIRSCMGDPLLRPAITQHKCNGVSLNPGGLYLEMALTASSYLWNHHHSSETEEPGINVHDLEIHKPLVVRDETKMSDLWLEMEVKSSSPSSPIEDATLTCTFHSITPSGLRLQENGNCEISFESSSTWLSSWSHHTSTILNRISKLSTRAQLETTGKVQLVQRTKAYDLFQSFVNYGPKYQNMSEVIFDTETLEATALLSFQPDPTTDFVGPYYLDGSCHLSGFVCNAVEKDKDKNAFISNGVGAMKLSSKFRPEIAGSETRTYVQMREMVGEKGVLAGDVYVLQNGEIVGVWESVRFKKIPRRVLNVFLPPPGKK